MNDLMQVHPSLARGQVWCRICGHTEKAGEGPFSNGWQKHCGYTMTIDSPEEQAAFAAKLKERNP